MFTYAKSSAVRFVHDNSNYMHVASAVAVLNALGRDCATVTSFDGIDYVVGFEEGVSDEEVFSMMSERIRVFERLSDLALVHDEVFVLDGPGPLPTMQLVDRYVELDVYTELMGLERWQSIPALMLGAMGHLEPYLDRYVEFLIKLVGNIRMECGAYSALDFDRDVDAFDDGGEWKLVTPSLSECIFSYGVQRNFSNSEVVDISLTFTALRKIAVVLADKLAQNGGFSRGEYAELLSLGGL